MMLKITNNDPCAAAYIGCGEDVSAIKFTKKLRPNECWIVPRGLLRAPKALGANVSLEVLG